MDHRINMRDRAFDMLKSRRPYPKGSHEWNWRTSTAWTFLQMSTRKPSIHWTTAPPPVTVTRPATLARLETA